MGVLSKKDAISGLFFGYISVLQVIQGLLNSIYVSRKLESYVGGCLYGESALVPFFWGRALITRARDI